MATIKIHNWKVTEADDTDALVFIPPEYHPTYWEVPKWWYKGDRTVYTSCVRVDLNDTTSIYIDGTTPLMQIQIDWDGSSLKATNYRDIRRVMLCDKDNLGAINQGVSDEYDDVEFFKTYYIMRVDNYSPTIIEPLISVLKPTFYSELPITAGASAPFDTWNGGVSPVTYEWRYKAKDYESDEWYSVGDWTAQTNAVQEDLILEKILLLGVHIESRAVDAEGTIVYNNSGARRAIPKVAKKPGSSVRYIDNLNTYESGTEVFFETAEFIGGVPPVKYRYRIQQRLIPSDSWTNGSWTEYDNEIITGKETITFAAGAQFRIFCQAVDSSQGSSKTANLGGQIKTIL